MRPSVRLHHVLSEFMMPSLDHRLRDVFASLFGVAPSALTADSSPDTIATWDSLNHLSLMMAIEADFGVQLEPTEMMSLRTFGAILERVSRESGA